MLRLRNPLTMRPCGHYRLNPVATAGRPLGSPCFGPADISERLHFFGLRVLPPQQIKRRPQVQDERSFYGPNVSFDSDKSISEASIHPFAQSRFLGELVVVAIDRQRRRLGLNSPQTKLFF
jgi:hypothetical protein